MRDNLKNILVVSVNWLGDAIFSTPVYHELKSLYPQARVVALCVPRVKDILAMCPDVDEVIIYDEDGEDRPVIRKWELVRKLKRYHFDAVFILRKSLSRSLLLWLAGIPVRVGFASNSWAGLLTCVVEERGNDERHRSDVYLRVVESYLGAPSADRICRVAAPADVCQGWRERFRSLGIKDGERVIAINTGGNWDLKQWPWEKFAELVRGIYQNRMGKVILPGAAKDVDRVNKIAQLSGESPIVVAGETGLFCLAGLLSQIDVLVTADTGPLHLASALGKNAVALFGPTSPEITGPRGAGRVILLRKDVGCNKAPCYYFECQNNRCMKAIEVGDVLQALQAIKG